MKLPVWVKDSAVDKCFTCKCQFTLYRRKQYVIYSFLY